MTPLIHPSVSGRLIPFRLGGWAHIIAGWPVPSSEVTDVHVLDAETTRMVDGVCDAIVPGSARVRPAVYIDALLARMDDGQRSSVLASFESLANDVIDEHLGTPEFLQVRALAIEAFYSDFVAPGVDATGAWAEIDFNTPLATRLAKDWSFLGIG